MEELPPSVGGPGLGQGEHPWVARPGWLQRAPAARSALATCEPGRKKCMRRGDVSAFSLRVSLGGRKPRTLCLTRARYATRSWDGWLSARWHQQK